MITRVEEINLKTGLKLIFVCVCVLFKFNVVQCCSRSTLREHKDYYSIRDGGPQEGHIDFHTAPEVSFCLEGPC